MKRRKAFCTLSIILMLTPLIALPIKVKAKTISQFEAEVENYTKQLEEKQANLAKNDAEVAAIKKKIANIEDQIASAEKEVAALQDEIDKSNQEIKAKSDESKTIMEYYQISNGDNVYLEYAFGATDITDMIYRLAVVEQLTDYNDKIMKELEDLIKANEEKQKELEKKQKELKDLKDSLEAEKARINADSASLRETMPAIEEQIKAAQANIKYYKELGCGKTEDIQACQYRRQQESGGSLPSVNGYYRPIQHGYITQSYYGYGGHLGIDIGSEDKTIEIYPIADGEVFYNSYDKYGAMVVKIRHNTGNGYIYSTYAHMSQVYSNVEVGSFISAFTPLGRMGSTGYSTGPHLHLEITSCDWNRGGGCTWEVYQQSTINPYRYINFPSYWNNR